MRSSSRLENLLPNDILRPSVKVTNDDLHKGYGVQETAQQPQEELPKNKIALMKMMAEARKSTSSKSKHSDRKNKKGKGKRKAR